MNDVFAEVVPGCGTYGSGRVRGNMAANGLTGALSFWFDGICSSANTWCGRDADALILSAKDCVDLGRFKEALRGAPGGGSRRSSAGISMLDVGGAFLIDSVGEVGSGKFADFVECRLVGERLALPGVIALPAVLDFRLFVFSIVGLSSR